MCVTFCRTSCMMLFSALFPSLLVTRFAFRTLEKVQLIILTHKHRWTNSYILQSTRKYYGKTRHCSWYSCAHVKPCQSITIIISSYPLFLFSYSIRSDLHLCLQCKIKFSIQCYACLGFYAVLTVFQLFKGDSSHIHVSWTIFVTSNWPVYYSDIGGPVVVLFPYFWTPRGKASTTSFKDFGLSRPDIEPTTSRSRGGRSNH